MTLTKAQILEAVESGTGHTDTVEAPELGEGTTLQVRGLAKGEVNRVNARAMRGQRVAIGAAAAARTSASGDDDGESAMPEDLEVALDIGLMQESAGDAELLAVAFGLSVAGETWVAAEAGLLPSAVVGRVLAKVRELTDDKDLLDGAALFRGHGRGARAGTAASSRGPAG